MFSTLTPAGLSERHAGLHETLLHLTEIYMPSFHQSITLLASMFPWRGPDWARPGPGPSVGTVGIRIWLSQRDLGGPTGTLAGWPNKVT